MFTITKADLKKLKFYTEKKYSFINLWESNIYFDPHQNNRWSIYKSRVTIQVYPESIDDIKTLIKMLTPPNN